MKKILVPVCALGALLLTANAKAEASPSGEVDFGSFTPPASGGQFVEVNIPPGLIAMAARLVEKQEPEVGQLLKGLHQVHVHVIGVDDQNRADLQERVTKVRKELETKGWERLVTAQEQQQNVGVYLKLRGKDSVEGLTVVVLEGNKQAVFVNIVGDIRPEQVAMLGDRLHIDPLKNLGPLGSLGSGEKKSEKAEKSEQ